MKAIKINAEKGHLELVVLPTETIEKEMSAIYDHLKCELFQCLSIRPDTDVLATLYVDEEGWLNFVPGETAGFVINLYKGHEHIIAGNGLIMGTDPSTGKSTAPKKCTLNFWSKHVRFLAPMELKRMLEVKKESDLSSKN